MCRSVCCLKLTITLKLDMVAQAWNLSTWEAEAESQKFKVQGQPGLYDILSQKASYTTSFTF